jgi:hypothetical protein
VPRSASAAEIKSAYRKRAKEIHPDINSHPNATADFQRLQEAFSVLGSPERKALYDQGDYAAATDPSTKATEADLEPMQCDACGCISAQLRFVLYDRVTSILLASYKQHLAGVFCPSCACKKLFFSTLITGAIGWLGFWGFFWSIAAVARNLAGGKHPPGLNAFLLGRQSLYLLRQGKNDVAHLLAKESIAHFKKCRTDDGDYSLGEIQRAVRQEAIDLRAKCYERKLRLTSEIRARWASSWRGAVKCTNIVQFHASMPALTGEADDTDSSEICTSSLSPQWVSLALVSICNVRLCSPPQRRVFQGYCRQ